MTGVESRAVFHRGRPGGYRGRRRPNRGSDGRSTCGASSPTRVVGDSPAWWRWAGVAILAAYLVAVVGLATVLGLGAAQ